MKKLSLLFLLIPAFAWSQNGYVKKELQPQGLVYYRLADDFKFATKYASDKYESLIAIFNFFQDYAKKDTADFLFNVSSRDISYINAETRIAEIRLGDTSIKTNLFWDELKWYKKFNAEKLARYKQIKDSTYRAKAKLYDDSVMLVKANEKKDYNDVHKVQSENNLHADNTNPYLKLAQSLDGIGQSDGVRNFTTFRGLDINFCNTRFSIYLQTNFGLSYLSSVDTKTSTLIKYAPRVSSSSQYINVKYTFQNRKDILGYMKTEDGTYNIVTGVEITGTKALIINLFLMYWKPLQTTIGGYKIGEVASKQFYSDKVSLIGVSPSIAKITIQQGNTTMDYNATYGINAPKK